MTRTQEKGEIQVNETKAREESETLCARLRKRGDADSLAAAAMIEGTLEAFREVFPKSMDESESDAYWALVLR